MYANVYDVARIRGSDHDPDTDRSHFAKSGYGAESEYGAEYWAMLLLNADPSRIRIKTKVLTKM
jgi:hypothetical protein